MYLIPGKLNENFRGETIWSYAMLHFSINFYSIILAFISESCLQQLFFWYSNCDFSFFSFHLHLLTEFSCKRRAVPSPNSCNHCLYHHEFRCFILHIIIFTYFVTQVVPALAIWSSFRLTSVSFWHTVIIF